MCEPALDPQNNCEEEIAVSALAEPLDPFRRYKTGQESTGFGYYFNY
jgi:hypothetical protein